MQTTQDRQNNIEMWIASVLMATVATIGAIVWLARGDTLFATLVQQGLAWCF